MLAIVEKALRVEAQTSNVLTHESIFNANEILCMEVCEQILHDVDVIFITDYSLRMVQEWFCQLSTICWII